MLLISNRFSHLLRLTVILAVGCALPVPVAHAYAPEPSGVSRRPSDRLALSPVEKHCSPFTADCSLPTPPSENPHICWTNCGNNPVNNIDPLGLWWWDAGIIEDGAGGLLGFYGRANTADCWQGSGRLAAESAAIYYNELSFGLLDQVGLTFTHEYQTEGHRAARGVGRVTRSVELGLAAHGALSSANMALAAAGGSTALYGTTAIRAGVTTLAVKSAAQNAGTATEGL